MYFLCPLWHLLKSQGDLIEQVLKKVCLEDNIQTEQLDMQNLPEPLLNILEKW